MLFHKLYLLTASTIHNVICAQQTENMRRANADLCILRESPAQYREGGGGGKRSATRDNEKRK